MVYWGCATRRNRCVWGACSALSLAGAALLCAGCASMWQCNHRGSSSSSGSSAAGHQALHDCRVRAGVLMAVGPLVVLLAVLPSLLFFISCLALPPTPPPGDWAEVRLDWGRAWRLQRQPPIVMRRVRITCARACCRC
jgi:hypothetical protein